jgi:hypothetical protein
MLFGSGLCVFGRGFDFLAFLAGLGFSFKCLGAQFACLELVNASCGVYELGLAGVEGVALGAYFNAQIFFHGRTDGEGVAAGAGDLDGLVGWVDACFHKEGACAQPW